MTITIKTKLDRRISGGGETHIEYEFTTGPRNLINAIEKLSEHRAENVRCYGNIGCGKSWLEIDGQVIDNVDLKEIITDDAEYCKYDSWRQPRSCTEKARQLLAKVSAHEYE